MVLRINLLFLLILVSACGNSHKDSSNNTDHIDTPEPGVMAISTKKSAPALQQPKLPQKPAIESNEVMDKSPLNLGHIPPLPSMVSKRFRKRVAPLHRSETLKATDSEMKQLLAMFDREASMVANPCERLTFYQELMRHEFRADTQGQIRAIEKSILAYKRCKTPENTAFWFDAWAKRLPPKDSGRLFIQWLRAAQSSLSLEKLSHSLFAADETIARLDPAAAAVVYPIVSALVKAKVSSKPGSDKTLLSAYFQITARLSEGTVMKAMLSLEPILNRFTHIDPDLQIEIRDSLLSAWGKVAGKFPRLCEQAVRQTEPAADKRPQRYNLYEGIAMIPLESAPLAVKGITCFLSLMRRKNIKNEMMLQSLANRAAMLLARHGEKHHGLLEQVVAFSPSSGEGTISLAPIVTILAPKLPTLAAKYHSKHLKSISSISRLEYRTPPLGAYIENTSLLNRGVQKATYLALIKRLPTLLPGTLSPQVILEAEVAKRLNTLDPKATAQIYANALGKAQKIPYAEGKIRATMILFTTAMPLGIPRVESDLAQFVAAPPKKLPAYFWSGIATARAAAGRKKGNAWTLDIVKAYNSEKGRPSVFGLRQSGNLLARKLPGSVEPRAIETELLKLLDRSARHSYRWKIHSLVAAGFARIGSPHLHTMVLHLLSHALSSSNWDTNTLALAAGLATYLPGNERIPLLKKVDSATFKDADRMRRAMAWGLIFGDTSTCRAYIAKWFSTAKISDYFSPPYTLWGGNFSELQARAALLPTAKARAGFLADIAFLL